MDLDPRIRDILRKAVSTTRADDSVLSRVYRRKRRRRLVRTMQMTLLTVTVVAASGAATLALQRTFAPGARPAAPSGEGVIAYSHQGDIWVIHPDGSGKRRLTSGPAYDTEPTWSPDGSRIAFQRDEDVYIVRSDGSAIRPLLATTRKKYSPAWSPDGTTIAYVAGPPAGGLHLFDLTQGTGRRLLSSGDVLMGAGSPAWSPDGLRLTFAKRFDKAEELVSYELGSGHTNRLTELNEPRTLGVIEPSWSPGGDRILFEVGEARIHSVAAKGGATEELDIEIKPYAARWAQDPDWAPDGSGFVFVAQRGELWLARFGARITSTYLTEGYSPAWWGPNPSLPRPSPSVWPAPSIGPFPGPEPSVGPAACGPPRRVIRVSVSKLAFDRACVRVPADTDLVILFRNHDPVPHSFTVLRGETPIFETEALVGPETTRFRYPMGPTPGTYTFQCSIHPTMRGRLEAV